jgi:hypothetical protein
MWQVKMSTKLKVRLGNSCILTENVEISTKDLVVNKGKVAFLLSFVQKIVS